MMEWTVEVIEHEGSPLVSMTVEKDGKKTGIPLMSPEEAKAFAADINFAVAAGPSTPPSLLDRVRKHWPNVVEHPDGLWLVGPSGAEEGVVEVRLPNGVNWEARMLWSNRRRQWAVNLTGRLDFMPVKEQTLWRKADHYEWREAVLPAEPSCVRVWVPGEPKRRRGVYLADPDGCAKNTCQDLKDEVDLNEIGVAWDPCPQGVKGWYVWSFQAPPIGARIQVKGFPDLPEAPVYALADGYVRRPGDAVSYAFYPGGLDSLWWRDADAQEDHDDA